MMTNEEAVAAIKKGKSDLIENLYYNNMPIINKVIYRYFPAQEADDLRQEAFITMLRVIDSYDADKGKFISYFTHALRWDLERYVTTCAGSVKIPPHTNDKLKELSRCRKTLELEKGSATRSDLARAMKITPAELDKLMQAENIRSPASIYSPIGEGNTELCDMLSGSDDIEAETVNREALKEIWQRVQEKLDEPAAQIIISYYRDEKTMQDLADSLGVTIGRIRGMRNAALKRLRQMREIHALCDYEIYSEAVAPVNFLQTRTSSTERVALKLDEIESRVLNMLNLKRGNDTQSQATLRS